MTSLNYHCFDLENNTVRLIAELWQQQTSPEGSPTHQETGTVRQAGNNKTKLVHSVNSYLIFPPADLVASLSFL